ncbi:excalibur calcium-binding domain-containing protein [Aquincola sp. J276]|uniref:excalibur calcium-binding domain-containing protein n=1 Tax=Aquincola sp. J276 TaxID=2898432 RepID=UPI002151729E|nr:excalibur calcium-binding domain-containing protein [Aquincola sp. J276]MCR5863786.1 excalibur calcium-binding domain-containing protein [Aquincola sp. J276]
MHISAFPADGSRPTVGEHLSYEPGTGANGKPQAVRAWRQAIGRPGAARRAPASVTQGRRGLPRLMQALLVTALLLGLAAYGWRAFQHNLQRSGPSLVPTASVERPGTAPSRFRCDGRTQCTQMTSCEEATYFLRHCPDTQMDGDADGVPCERQWCGRPW